MNTIAAVAEAVLNSLWQSLVLAGLIWSALRLLKGRVNAATRHVIWWFALAATAVSPFIPHQTAPAPVREQARPMQSAPAFPVQVAAPLKSPGAEGPVTVVRRQTAIWPLWLLVIWAAALVRELVLVVRSYLRLRGIKQRATVWSHPLPDTGREAQLLVSSEIASPIAAGFLHPAVIVPAKLRERLVDDALDCVLLHESAHLARYDDWINLMARVVRALFGLHPAVRWILLQIEREREMACDDWAVAHTGAAYGYAESLARVMELSTEAEAFALAAGMFTGRSRLRARIESLLERGRNFSPVTARRPLAAAAIGVVVLAAAAGWAPRWIVLAQRLEFEVASVKHSPNEGPFRSAPQRSGDRFSMHGAQLYSIIYYAYHLRGNYQLVGDLGYGSDEWNSFDVEARVGRNATEDEVRLMLQSLLADRFKLKLHREQRELREFEVSIAKGGPKLSATTDPDKPMEMTIEGRHFQLPKHGCAGTRWTEGNHLGCHGATIEQILQAVGGELGAPVRDSTGLTGTYDVSVMYRSERRANDNADVVTAPPLKEVFQKQLGLKIEEGKGPVEVIVVDHFEKKPTEN